MKRSEFAVAETAKKKRTETSETPPRDRHVVAFDIAQRLTDRPSPSVEADGDPGDVKRRARFGHQGTSWRFGGGVGGRTEEVAPPWIGVRARPNVISSKSCILIPRSRAISFREAPLASTFANT